MPAKTETTTTDVATEQRNGRRKFSPEEIGPLFDNGYREVEILPDRSLRPVTRNGDPADELVTRTLKTGRTQY